MKYRIVINWRNCIRLDGAMDGTLNYLVKIKRVVYMHEGIPPYETLQRLVDKCKIEDFKVSLWNEMDNRKKHKVLTIDEEGYYTF